MKNNGALAHFVAQMATDQRLNNWHLALFTALTYLGRNTPTGHWFTITRQLTMQHAGIRSPVTYHHYLSELIKHGYIRYEPSYHPGQGSKVAIMGLTGYI